MTNLIDENKLNKILKEESLKTIDKYKLYPSMSQRELENTLSLFTKLNDSDLDLLIIHMQYLRALRNREKQEQTTYKFCDKCNITLPNIYKECFTCKNNLRQLPIKREHSYLLDGDYKE